MSIKIAINGLGRIGRLVAKAAILRDDIELVAINDLIPLDQIAYLMRYDSTHGPFEQEITVEGDSLIINGQKIHYSSKKNPEELPWKNLAVDYVVESTGLFLQHEAAAKHIKAGAKKVILSAPAKDKETPTFVMGVNQESYNPETDHVISNASCTTNCLAPLTKVLLDNFGIKEGLMTTTHAVTAGQTLVDGASKKDWRIGRSGLHNIIPSSTGAAKAVALCIPELSGKLTGMAFRVPLTDVSVVDLTVKLERPTSLDEIEQKVIHASKNEMKGILFNVQDPIVSSDCIGNTHSSIFDRKASIELNSTFFKLISWYDNEMGYSHRILDLISYIASKDGVKQTAMAGN
jgi:glyceraldehyde 3-phosphate dehydrogenase